MKEQILKLRSECKTYNEIQKELGCSKGLIAYYCGEGQKEKGLQRKRKNRKDNVLNTKLSAFKSRTLSEKARSFQRRQGCYLIPRKEYNFVVEDVLNKIGTSPKCYLSGRSIDITNSKSFHFDHIIPSTKGGSNQLDNLGVADAAINKMKHDMNIDEFILACKEVLEYNGYKVIKEI